MTHRYGHRQRKSRGQNGTWLHVLLLGVHSRRCARRGVHEECNGRWPCISLAPATTSDRSWPPGRRAHRENNGISRGLFITGGGHVYPLSRQGLAIYSSPPGRQARTRETTGFPGISRGNVSTGGEREFVYKKIVSRTNRKDLSIHAGSDGPGHIFRPARAWCKHSLTGERRRFGKLTFPRRIPCGSLLCELDSPPSVEYLALARHPHPRP